MLATNVSVCMIAKNCSDVLPVSLGWATQNFEEVNVVVDVQNSDATDAVLATFSDKMNINIISRRFDNFSSQKNAAFDMATRPWILSVDSDEIFEDGIPWDNILRPLEYGKVDVAAFDLYNLQIDKHHFKLPILPKPRLIRKSIAKMDGKPADEGLDLFNKKLILYPYALIHFGHIRDRDHLLLKGKDRIKFVDDDPCDGPGMKIHGENWFIERNKEWEKEGIVEVPFHVKLTIEKYAKEFI